MHLTKKELEVLHYYRNGNVVKSEDSDLVGILRSRGLLTDGFHEEYDEGGELKAVYPTTRLTRDGINQSVYNGILRSHFLTFVYRLCHGF